jgi:hypothetical protein
VRYPVENEQWINFERLNKVEKEVHHLQDKPKAELAKH